MFEKFMIKHLKNNGFIVCDNSKAEELADKCYKCYEKTDNILESLNELSESYYNTIDNLESILEKLKTLKNNTWDKKLVNEISDKIRYSMNILTYGLKEVNNDRKDKSKNK